MHTLSTSSSPLFFVTANAADIDDDDDDDDDEEAAIMENGVSGEKDSDWYLSPISFSFSKISGGTLSVGMRRQLESAIFVFLSLCSLLFPFSLQICNTARRTIV
jgi:hypothetical protein